MKILLAFLLMPFLAVSQQVRVGPMLIKPDRNISGQDSLLIEKKDSGYTYRISLNEMKQLSGLNKVYNVVNVQALNAATVTDAQTIYFGSMPKAPVTVAATSKIYFRQAGSIQSVEIYSFATTAGTGEAWSIYVRKNNTTDYLISTVSVANSERVFSNTNINIPIQAGDYIEIKSVNPTWATNPANITFGGYITIN